MNREIKFRAWCPERKMICEVVCIKFSNDEITVKYPDGHGFTDKMSSVVLMQYTGLKDKNGKEIYEGDIVKLEKFSEGTKNLEVYIDKWGVFPFREPTISGEGGSEIIGNIYENPVLLTK